MHRKIVKYLPNLVFLAFKHCSGVNCAKERHKHFKIIQLFRRRGATTAVLKPEQKKNAIILKGTTSTRMWYGVSAESNAQTQEPAIEQIKKKISNEPKKPKRMKTMWAIDYVRERVLSIYTFVRLRALNTQIIHSLSISRIAWIRYSFSQWTRRTSFERRFCGPPK